MNSGDTAWLLIATALVMVMLPGLALFYGGLVRRKNVLSTIMHSFFGLAIVSVVWVLVGFTLAFGPDLNGWGLIGNLDFIGFNNVGLEPEPGLRGHHPVRPVRVIPADVRGHHAGAHHRRVRRAQALRRLRALHDPLVDPRLLAARALGVGAGRLAAQPGRDRLRGRHRRPHQLGRLGAGGGHPHRQANQERRPHGAARRAHDRARRRAALVRLVRVQRRVGARRPPARRPTRCW